MADAGGMQGQELQHDALMPSSAQLLIAAVMAVAGTAGASSMAATTGLTCLRSDEADRARVIAEMVLAHDQSIESLVWKQELSESMACVLGTVVVSSADGTSPQLDERREIHHWAEVAVDRRGRYLAMTRHRMCQPEIDAVASDSEPSLVSKADGVLRWTPIEYVTTHFDGALLTIVTDVGGRPTAMRGAPPSQSGIAGRLTPLTALGRHLDLSGRRLGEVLLSAAELRVERIVEDDRGTIAALTGVADFGGPWADFRVEVDLGRGGCPRRVEVRNPHLDTLLWLIVVDEVIERDGVWIPARARYGYFSPYEPYMAGGATTRRVVEHVASSLGIDVSAIPRNFSDPVERAAWRRAHVHVHGPSGPPCRVVGYTWLEVTEIRAVNQCPEVEHRVEGWCPPEDALIMEAWQMAAPADDPMRGEALSPHHSVEQR